MPPLLWAWWGQHLLAPGHGGCGPGGGVQGSGRYLLAQQLLLVPGAGGGRGQSSPPGTGARPHGGEGNGGAAGELSGG